MWSSHSTRLSTTVVLVVAPGGWWLNFRSILHEVMACAAVFFLFFFLCTIKECEVKFPAYVRRRPLYRETQLGQGQKTDTTCLFILPSVFAPYRGMGWVYTQGKLETKQVTNVLDISWSFLVFARTEGRGILLHEIREHQLATNSFDISSSILVFPTSAGVTAEVLDTVLLKFFLLLLLVPCQLLQQFSRKRNLYRFQNVATNFDFASVCNLALLTCYLTRGAFVKLLTLFCGLTTLLHTISQFLSLTFVSLFS